MIVSVEHAALHLANEVGDWLHSLKDASDRPLAALTRNTFWLRLSALFNFARERGWCSENPLLESHKAKVRSSVIEPLDLTQREEALRATLRLDDR